MGGSPETTINGRPVIRTECGPKTGETIYVTRNGRRWTDEVEPWHYVTTGITIAPIMQK